MLDLQYVKVKLTDVMKGNSVQHTLDPMFISAISLRNLLVLVYLIFNIESISCECMIR